MSLRDDLASDLAAAIAGYGQTFEWRGSDWPCVRRDLPTAFELQDAGGEIEQLDYWLVVAKAAFPDAQPQRGDGVNHMTGQIKNIGGDEDPASVRLVLHIGSFDR